MQFVLKNATKSENKDKNDNYGNNKSTNKQTNNNKKLEEWYRKDITETEKNDVRKIRYGVTI